MYGTNGRNLCNGNTNFPIIQVIWPDYYAPIILLDQGQTFATYSEFNCSPIKTYEMDIVTGVKG